MFEGPSATVHVFFNVMGLYCDSAMNAGASIQKTAEILLAKAKKKKKSSQEFLNRLEILELKAIALFMY